MRNAEKMAAVLMAAVLLLAGCGDGTVQTAAQNDGEGGMASETVAVTGTASAGTQTTAEVDGNVGTEEISVVSQTFSHRKFMDSIAFILPQGWSYDTFETVVAGEDMDAREWGVHVFIGGDQNLRFTVCGTNETEARTGNSEPFQTGSGLTGKKYVEGTTGEDGQAYWEFCLVFEGIEGGGAEYKIYGGLGQEEYEQYVQALDDFAAGVSIVTVARD